MLKIMYLWIYEKLFSPENSVSDDHIWTPDLQDALASSETFPALYALAAEILPLHDQPLGMLCGPISSGGEGSILELNLEIFGRAIPRLRAEGFNLFDQIPFEPQMHRIIRSGNGYYLGSDQLLEEFYRPIFESGFLKFLIFLPTWPTSNGAQWEHREAIRLDISRKYLSREWYDDLKT